MSSRHGQRIIRPALATMALLLALGPVSLIAGAPNGPVTRANAISCSGGAHCAQRIGGPAVVTDTPTPTDTAVPTDTPIPTDTPFPTDTSTPTITPTATSYVPATPGPNSIPGNIWITGHDQDHHCNDYMAGVAACHYFQIALDFVRAGSPLPVLVLDSGPEVATSIANAYGSNAPPYVVVSPSDPSSGFATMPFLAPNGTPLYSAILDASDYQDSGCGCDDTTADANAVNARAADIQEFYNAGGGILAFAGGPINPGDTTPYYNFLPVPAAAVAVSYPFTLTAIGQALGLQDDPSNPDNSDINCCETHNSFQIPPPGSPLQVAEVDSQGFAETLVVSRVRIVNGGFPTNTPTTTAIPAPTNTSAPPAPTNTPAPPAATSTPLPPTSTPAPPTTTPVPPTNTTAPPPPGATNTTAPPQPPPAATNTTAPVVQATPAPTGPHITLSPSSGPVGTCVTVRGAGFAPGEQITLALNGAAVGTTPGTITTTKDGTFTARFCVPSGLLQGANTISATGTKSRAPALATFQGRVAVAAQFYFAGGMNTGSEQSALQVLNPSSRAARVRLTFYFGNGATTLSTVNVGPTTDRTIAVARLIRRRGAFGLAVTANRHIAAQLLLTRRGEDGDSILGNTGLGTRWYLAEGYIGLTFHESVALLNPDPTRVARVQLRLQPIASANITGQPSRTVTVVVPAHTHTVVNINRLLRLRYPSLSITVLSSHPIVVERTLTFSKGGYGGGYGLTARAGINTVAATWLFAEGSTTNHFQTFLTLLNPGDRPAHATARFYGSGGGLLARRAIRIAARSRANIKLNNVVHASGVASVVTSDRPLVVERPEYFGSPNGRRIAGSDVFGRNGPAVEWSFPGGDTRGSTDLLLLFNPSSRTIPVDVTVYGSTGRHATKRVFLRPTVRYTLDVGRTFPGLTGLHGATLRATNGQGFVAEQTVYATTRSTLYSTQGLAQ